MLYPPVVLVRSMGLTLAVRPGRVKRYGSPALQSSRRFAIRLSSSSVTVMKPAR